MMLVSCCCPDVSFLKYMAVFNVCPFFFDKQHLSYDVCLEVSKSGDYQNCSVLYCVLKLCTVISTFRFLQFPGLGFVTLAGLPNLPIITEASTHTMRVRIFNKTSNFYQHLTCF